MMPAERTEGDFSYAPQSGRKMHDKHKIEFFPTQIKLNGNETDQSQNECRGTINRPTWAFWRERGYRSSTWKDIFAISETAASLTVDSPLARSSSATSNAKPQKENISIGRRLQSLSVSLWSETYLPLGEEINSATGRKTYLLLSGATVLPMQSKWSSRCRANEVDCRGLQVMR